MGHGKKRQEGERGYIKSPIGALSLRNTNRTGVGQGSGRGYEQGWYLLRVFFHQDGGLVVDARPSALWQYPEKLWGSTVLVWWCGEKARFAYACTARGCTKPACGDGAVGKRMRRGDGAMEVIFQDKVLGPEPGFGIVGRDDLRVCGRLVDGPLVKKWYVQSGWTSTRCLCIRAESM